MSEVTRILGIESNSEGDFAARVTPAAFGQYLREVEAFRAGIDLAGEL